MRILHTVLRQDEELDKEFERGALACNCSISKAISSADQHCTHLFHTWKQHFDRFAESYTDEKEPFIGIQNNLVLEGGEIELLLEELKGCDIALFSDVNKTYNFKTVNDSFFAAKAKVIHDLPIRDLGPSICPLCDWILCAMNAGYSVKYAKGGLLRHAWPKKKVMGD